MSKVDDGLQSWFDKILKTVKDIQKHSIKYKFEISTNEPKYITLVLKEGDTRQFVDVFSGFFTWGITGCGFNLKSHKDKVLIYAWDVKLRQKWTNIWKY